MTFPLQFIKKEQKTKTIYSFYFSKPKNFSYQAGQYLNFILNENNTEPNPNRMRFFTMSSSPTEKEIVLTTKISNTLFKKRLNKLDPQTWISASGPMGGLTLNPEIKGYIFLATGNGITPFRSMIKYVIDKKIQIQITLFASFAQKEDVIFYAELKKIEKTSANIKVIYTLTKGSEPEFEHGRISAVTIEKYEPNFLKKHFMIVGLPEMVTQMEEVISNMGVPDEQIQIENYTGY